MKDFAKRVFIAVVVIGAIALAAYVLEWLLLLLAGVLLALLFRTSAEWLHEKTNLSIRWGIAIVLLITALVATGIVWEFGSKIAEEADQFMAQLSQSLNALRERAQQYPTLQRFVSSPKINLADRAENLLYGTVWTAAAAIVVLFVGVYVSVSPDLYVQGLLRLFPKPRHEEIRATLHDAGTALKWWLLGQLIAMAAVSVITAIGLLLLNIPMALPLAVVAGALTFVPYVGSIVSAIPALLIGFTISPYSALYVVFVYLIAHTIEGYIVVPAVQHRLIYLPPALIIANQFLMELLAGIVGIAFGTPLLVLIMVLVKRFYLHEQWSDNREAA